MASPSPRWASDAALSRAIVAEDELVEEAHSWWACLMVCRAHQRSPPLAAATLEAVAPAVEAASGPVLLTPRQAWRLGARVDEIDEACPTAGPLTGSTPTPFSLEYVYPMAALAGRSDRVFRKACRRAETALAARKLPLGVHAWSGSEISDEVLRRCESCRRRWMERRAAGARAAAKREGRRYEGPPWAGVTKRGYLAAAAELRALPGGRAVALLVVTAPPQPHADDSRSSATTGSDRLVMNAEGAEGAAGAEGSAEGAEGAAVFAYLLTERVGRTVVAVEGVHDYALPGVDPSALLLHHAACWWDAEARREGAGPGGRAPRPPLFLNDGPVPTAGLLRYKAQYHGALLQVYSLRSAALLRASARARWPALLAAWRRTRGGGLHVGEKKIRRAARRLYATQRTHEHSTQCAQR